MMSRGLVRSGGGERELNKKKVSVSYNKKRAPRSTLGPGVSGALAGISPDLHCPGLPGSPVYP